jgi:hypothetical protein
MPLRQNSNLQGRWLLSSVLGVLASLLIDVFHVWMQFRLR